ncbi:MAG: hypothetical protein JJU48_03125 [Methylophaga sp.]|nr:hypothetical protein [Methylophaga sp.]
MSEEKENATAIELECPSCAEVNTIDTQRTIHCKKCSKPITGHRYKLAGLAIIPFVLGAAGYGFVDWKFLAEDRYPLRHEYSLVDACINGNQSALSWQNHSRKQTVCFCAVEKTIENYAYADYRKDQSAFIRIMNSNLRECI